jgi:uroporphyrinogen-III synthase
MSETPVPVVILTREKEDNRPLAERLCQNGYQFVEYPCIKTVPAPLSAVSSLRNKNWEQTDVVIFTSKRAVTALKIYGIKFGECHPRIACVGGSTAEAVQRHIGQKPWLVADPPAAESLARMLAEKCRPEDRLLHIRGSKTTGGLKSILSRRGYHLDDIVVYRHQNLKNAPLRIKGPGIAVLASPSAAACFLEHNLNLQTKLVYLTIGPTTADYLKNQGIPDVYQAKKPDADSLLAEIIRITNVHHFENKNEHKSSQGNRL